MRLSITLLGGQTIIGATTDRGRGTSGRAFALLTWLVVHASVPQSRYLIAGTLWPESGDAQSLTNLRRELHTLRRMLGDHPCLVITSRDLCWADHADVAVDVRQFEIERAAALAAADHGDVDAALIHAQRAVAHYQGDLLPGAYDTWLIDARAELQRRCADLCALVAGWHAERGAPVRALEAARRRLALEPLDETGYRTLMELQEELGDRAGAVTTYHRCASILERELGVEPDDDTRTVLRRVMEHPPRDGRGTPGRTTRPLPAERPRVGASGFVGRARERTALLGAWQAAELGRAGLAVVRGSAGVGKTRLASEVAEEVRQRGAVVAASQCFGTSGRLALAPVADWLRSATVRAAAERLDQVWRDEVDRLVPSGAGSPQPVDGTRALVDAWQRHRFFEGLARALLAVDRPTMLVLDNLQWCDRETLAFLGFALQLSPEAPILVCATLRTDAVDDDLDVTGWVAQMRATTPVTELELNPLEPDDTGRLARAVSGRAWADPDVDLLQATTGGFPLHIIEAMRAVQDQDVGSLPAGDLALVLRSRLEQASPAAREVAGLAAAVGRDFPLDLLVEASDLTEADVVQAVDDLWRHRILTEREGSYDFSHDLLRDAAYAEISPPRRWLLHRRLAQSLELLHGDDIDRISAQLAEQYVRGGRPERAVPYYLRAADLASGVFAHDEAIRLHSEALAIVRRRTPGRETDRQELAVLEAMAAPLNAREGYASPALQSVLERSVDLAESLANRESLLNALVGLWASRFVQGRVAEAHETAGRALTLVREGSEYRGAAHFVFGGSAVSLGRPGEGAEHFALAEQFSHGESVSVGTRPDVHGRAWAAHAHWLLGDDERAVAACEGAVALARSVNHPYSLAVALAYAAITQQLRLARDEVLETVAELHQLCERYGFGYYREWALVLDGWCRRGPDGVELARRGIARLRAEGSFARMPYWLSLLAELRHETGDADGARSVLDAAVASAVARCDVWWLPEVKRMRAAFEDPEAAVRSLREAAATASSHGSLALLERCRADLVRYGVDVDVPSVRH